MLTRFRSWLANRRSFLFSWYTKDRKETQEPEKSLLQLPQAIKKKLGSAVENLPSNPADQKAIAEALNKVYDRWRDEPDGADNSIVILSSPVTTVSRILSETLQEWADEKQVPMKLLPLTARPHAIETTRSKLEHHLKQKSVEDDSEETPLEVVVIPNLSWCFLRSLEGLEGIEYLQYLLCNGSKNRFWIIGAGQVGWQYLNSVCSLEAYCGEVFSLPAIASEDLEQWLTPICQDLDIVFDKPRLDRQLLDGDKNNQTNYFASLASISKGVSTVAVQGFLKSIRYQKPEGDETEDQRKQESKLVAQIPKLPELPELEQVDRYLLYSLLLHGDLTISALAESLGDEEAEVQARIEILRRKGVAEQKDRVVKINPIYYPKLKQELSSNNFIITRE
ncbi:hypothetical protein I4641_00175 [Waterburya agarophytonicola K14]|uniref:Uncharacterized protein n=2 Tax=Waterburya TaxID=2886915 RepID=A0A964BNR6_9CYAN|nr:hypothetical protein [Waterburya agarophytonicola]MCC0175396.1 hypothetical protein [Waterburya agarophytonicola KI4]